MVLNANATAQSAAIDPQLLERFTLVTENDQILVEVSMRNLLLLALERATLMDILSINKKIATEAYNASKEIYHPNLTTTFGTQRALTVTGTNISGSVLNPYTGKTASFLGLQATDVTALSTTWSKKTTSGIAYSLGYQKASSQINTGGYAEEGDSFNGWEKYDDSLYTDKLIAAISVPIFQDWGEINKFSEYKSLIGLESTEIESKRTVLDLLEQVAGIYWDLVGVENNILTLQASENLSLQFVADTKVRMELGVLDPIEVKQGESQLLLVQQNLLTENFQKKQIEDQIKVALNLEDIPYGYRATEKMMLRRESFDFETLLKTVHENNQDLALLESQLKLNGIQLKEAQNQAKTNLDFNLQYQFNGYGKSTASASSLVSETNLHDYQLGLSWTVPLFDKQTPQIIRQRSLEHSRLILQIDNVKAQLKVTLQSILRNLQVAEQGIKLASASVELARDLLEKETEKFKLGNNTSFRVAQVQQDLTDAQKNKTLSQVSYEKAYLKLLIITGRIIKQFELPTDSFE
jgi:outer membrane protein TolC